MKRVQTRKENVSTEFGGNAKHLLDITGIRDPRTGRVLTIGDAIQMRILDVRTGEMIVGDDKRISLEEAVKQGLIDAKLAHQLLQPGAGRDASGRDLSLLEVIQREISEAESGYETAEKRIKVTHEESIEAENPKNIADAISAGNVDTKTGLYRVKSGKTITLAEAYERGYLIRHESVTIKSNALCLSDAIGHGLVDTAGWIADRNSGDKFRLDSAIANQLIDPNVREVVDAKNDNKITLNEALKLGILNPKTGRYWNEVTKEKLTFIEAKNRQLIVKPYTLKDICDLNLMDKQSKITSPMRREKLSIMQAIESGVLDGNNLKCVTKRKGELITLQEAIADGIVLPAESKYRDFMTGEIVSIPEAVERGLISSVSQKSIFDIDGFKDMVSNDFVSFNVASSRGILRRKSTGFALETSRDSQVPLEIAMKEGLIRPEVYEMFNKGIGVHNASGKELNVFDLCYHNLIDPKTGYLLDPKTGETVPLDLAIERKFITPEGALLLSSLLNITLTTETVTRTINRYVTIRSGSQEPSETHVVLTFTEAVRQGFIDEERQLFKDPKTGKIYSVQQALTYGLLQPDINDPVPEPTNRKKTKSTITIVTKQIVPESEPIKMNTQKFIEKSVEIPIAQEVLKTGKINTDFIQNEKTSYIENNVQERQIIELPPGGWPLKDAIDQGLFNPETGVFHIRSTERVVTFEECITKYIINSLSVSVIDPKTNEKLSIRNAFERDILDSFGNYTNKNNDVQTMRSAINENKIILEPVPVTKTSAREQCILRISKINNLPEIVEISTPLSSESSPKFVEVLTLQRDLSSPEPLQIAPGAIYDPSTALVIFTHNGQTENVFDAARHGLIDESLIKILDPKTKSLISIGDAIARKIYDPQNATIVTEEGYTVDVLTAIQKGLVVVSGAPLVAAEGALRTIRFVTDPRTGEQIPVEVAYERGIVSKDQLRKTKSFESDTCEEKVVVLQKMRKIILKPSDAFKKGIIDEKTKEILEDKRHFLDNNDQVITISESLERGLIDGNSGKVVDPQRNRILNISEAVKENIIDPEETNHILIPLVKSLSIPKLMEQGLIDTKTQTIIHPESGYGLNIREAIVCEVLDPYSKLKRPYVCSIEEAIEKNIVDQDKCTFNVEGKVLNFAQALSEDIFDSNYDKQESVVSIAPVGMTFPVVVERGLLNPEKAVIVHPENKKEIPLKNAIENGFIMSIPYPPKVDAVEVQNALEQGLINVIEQTFKHPKENERFPIRQALENGQLVVKHISDFVVTQKPLPKTEVMETITAVHTVTTKTIELIQGYILISNNEVQNVKTGEICSIEEAKAIGILREEESSKETRTVTENKDSIPDNANITSKESLTKNLQEIPEHKSLDIKHEKSNIETTPQTFKTETVEVLQRDDTLKDSTKSSTLNTVKEAAKMGALGIVAAPVLAGGAIVSGIKQLVKTSTKSSTEEPQKSAPQFDTDKAYIPKKDTTPPMGESQQSPSDISVDSVHTSEATLTQFKTTTSTTITTITTQSETNSLSSVEEPSKPFQQSKESPNVALVENLIKDTENFISTTTANFINQEQMIQEQQVKPQTVTSISDVTPQKDLSTVIITTETSVQNTDPINEITEVFDTTKTAEKTSLPETEELNTKQTTTSVIITTEEVKQSKSIPSKPLTQVSKTDDSVSKKDQAQELEEEKRPEFQQEVVKGPGIPEDVTMESLQKPQNVEMELQHKEVFVLEKVRDENVQKPTKVDMPPDVDATTVGSKNDTQQTNVEYVPKSDEESNNDKNMSQKTVDVQKPSLEEDTSSKQTPEITQNINDQKQTSPELTLHQNQHLDKDQLKASETDKTEQDNKNIPNDNIIDQTPTISQTQELKQDKLPEKHSVVTDFIKHEMTSTNKPFEAILQPFDSNKPEVKIIETNQSDLKTKVTTENKHIENLPEQSHAKDPKEDISEPKLHGPAQLVEEFPEKIVEKPNIPDEEEPQKEQKPEENVMLSQQVVIDQNIIKEQKSDDQNVIKEPKTEENVMSSQQVVKEQNVINRDPMGKTPEGTDINTSPISPEKPIPAQRRKSSIKVQDSSTPTEIVKENITELPSTHQKHQDIVDFIQNEKQDPKDGKNVMQNVKDAAKLGAMAIVGAPILAGKALVDAFKNEEKPSEYVNTISTTSSAAATTVTTISSTINEPLKTVTKTESDIDTVKESIPSRKVEPPQTLAIGDAISQNLISPDECQIVVDGQKQDQSVTELLKGDQLSPLDEVQILDDKLVVLQPMSYLVDANDELTPEHLSELNIYDTENQYFIDPSTGMKISFQTLVFDMNVFNPETILVKNFSTGKYETLTDALERPLLDRHSGHMVDPKTGKKIPFFECVSRNWIIRANPEKEKPAAIENVIDPATGKVILDNGRVCSIVDAINNGLLDIQSISVRDPVSGEVIPLRMAIELGVVDMQAGTVIDIQTLKEIPMEDAFKLGFLVPGARKPISLEAAVRKGLYDPETGKLYDSESDVQVDVQKSIEIGLVDPKISLIVDSKSQKEIKLDCAIEDELVVAETGKIKDTKTNTLVPFDVGVEKKLVKTDSVTWSLPEVLQREYYSPKTGKILNPSTGEEILLQQAIEHGFVELDSCLVKDDEKNTIVPGKQAAKEGLLDTVRGCLSSPNIKLDEAFVKGYLISTKKPLSLVDCLLRGLYDPDTAKFNIDDKRVDLKTAISLKLINAEELVLLDPKTESIISLTEAISKGYIDPVGGFVINPFAGTKLSLNEALENRILIPPKRKRSLPDAVYRGLYDPKTGEFSNTITREKLSTERAIRRGILDPDSTIVNVAGEVLPFEKAAQVGIVDSHRGTVRDDEDKPIDFKEAFDRGVLLEAKKPLRLIEAVIKNVYDEIDGSFMDPKTGLKLSFAEAVDTNLLDCDSVQIRDFNTGLYKQLNLSHATESGVIDGSDAKLVYNNQKITIKHAFDVGILIDTQAPLSLQRALHQGLFDDKTGKLTDPKSGRKITLLESIRSFVINPQLPCYFDELQEQMYNLTETCRMGIINRREGVFREPGSNTFVSLNEALSLGLIVDIENASFGLYELLAMGFYDRTTRKVIHPVTGRKLNLNEACIEDVVSLSSSLVKNNKSGKYVRLAQAIKEKIIDDTNGCYNLSDSEQIDLQEARSRGLIVSNRRLLCLELIMRMQLFRQETGKFCDPTTGDFCDLAEAIQNGFIDPATTVFKNHVTGKELPLNEAIENGDIDVTKGRVFDPKSKSAYNYDIALSRGILVTITKPLTERTEVVKRQESVELLSQTPVSVVVSKPREMSLEEAIKYNIIDPKTALVRDFETFKFIPFEIAQQNGNIDLSKRTLVDPKALYFAFDQNLIVYIREPITFDYAAESKILDLQTGMLKYPDQGDQKVPTHDTDSSSEPIENELKTYTLKDATTMGIIDPDSALIKDLAKSKLVRLPEAFRKGLMDANKANVLNTKTSKLCTLNEAYENGLIVTPKRSFGLLEAISFNLYNPTNGCFIDPFQMNPDIIKRKKFSLADSISSGLIDPSSTVVRNPSTGEIIPLTAAIQTGLIDPIEGRINDPTDSKNNMDLVKAAEKGLLLLAEQRVSLSLSILLTKCL